MSARPFTTVLEHTLLQAPVGSTEGLSGSGLQDGERMAVWLQIAAVLTLLPSRGPLPLESLRVDEAGVLRRGSGGRLRPTTRSLSPQLQLARAGRLLFGSEARGRGRARRVARQLLLRWQQELVDLSPDRLVGEMLEAAPFLWEPRHAAARSSLVVEAASGLRVAGPAPLRSRVLDGGRTYEEAIRRLTTVDAASVVGGLYASASGPLERAEAAYAAGRSAECEALLRGRTRDAPCLAFLCAVDLGRLQAARRRLARATPDLVEGSDRFWAVCRAAIRLFANLGQHRPLRLWMARALRAGRTTGSALGPLLAAQGYWDLGAEEPMRRQLTRAAATARPEQLAELEQTQALRHLRWGEPGRAVDCLARALRVARRELSASQAGRLWNDLVSARALKGDLEGAERAARHAFRLLQASRAPAAQTLALHNLAEIRLRRGRLAGVEAVLERVEESNRSAHNRRASFYDLELRGRLLLATGAPEAAAALLDDALLDLESAGEDHNENALRVLAARAHGLSGHSRRARELLEGVEAHGALEPEEMAPLWALAGDLEAALGAAAGPTANLWRQGLRGLSPSPSSWRAWKALEPFRRARSTLDLVLCGVQVDVERCVSSAAHLRRWGAEPLAERLELSSRPLLEVLAKLGGSAPSVDQVQAILERVGGEGCEIGFLPRRAVDPLVLAPGAGGPHVVEVEGRRGVWSLALAAPRPDLESLFRLLVLGLPAVSEPESEPPTRTGADILGQCPKLHDALRRARLLSNGRLPILVQGESGTGKELMARLCHLESPRRDGPFVAVNCAALSESLALSELFGHVRGAFTGAESDRRGAFEEAGRGTIFLDEIGDLHPRAQGMLLRVLQEGEIQRVGETKVRPVDVRVVAATHRDLARQAEKGEFRQDLYFRLRVGTVELPPLRERGGDVEILAEAFVSEHDLGLAPEALATLRAHDWPGNVRELKASVDAASLLASGEGRSRIEPSDLDLPGARAAESLGYHDWLHEQRCRKVSEALRASAGNQSAAARRLGLSRQAMSYLVRELGLRAP